MGIFNKLTIQILAWIARILSIGISVLFWSQLSSEPVGSILLALGGVLFDATKFVALLIAIDYYRLKRYCPALLLLPICMIFSVVSIFCSIAVLQYQVSNQQTIAIQNDTSYLNQQKAIQIQEDKITTLQQLAAKDTQYGYRERAKSTTAQIAVEQAKLSTLHQQLQQQHSPPQGLLSHVPKKYLNITIYFLGSLFELTAMFLSWAACTPRANFKTHSMLHSKAHSKSGVQDTICQERTPSSCTGHLAQGLENKEKKRTPSALQGASSCTSQSAKTSASRSSSSSLTKELGVQCVKAIKSAVVKPTTRALRNHFNIGSKHACQLLRDLANQGLLIAKGNGYAVA